MKTFRFLTAMALCSSLFWSLPEAFTQEPGERLFVQNFQSGRLTPAKQPGELDLLVLKGVSPSVFLFQIKEGAMPISTVPAEEFTDLLRQADEEDRKTPHTALDLFQQSEGIYVVEIFETVYDTEQAEIRCRVRVIEDETKRPQRLSHRTLEKALPASFGQGALFADNF